MVYIHNLKFSVFHKSPRCHPSGTTGVR